MTRREGYAPYRSILESVFGKDKSFFLDKEGEWERFVKEVVKHLEKNENHKRSFINFSLLEKCKKRIKNNEELKL